VVEPDLAELEQSDPEPSIMDAHTMNPLSVLRLARSMGAPLRHVLLVGCEPATLGPEEGHMGLSQPVERAVDQAVSVVESLVARLRTTDGPSQPKPTSR
jgi:hydrogenase maturation protease